MNGFALAHWCCPAAVRSYDGDQAVGAFFPLTFAGVIPLGSDIASRVLLRSDCLHPLSQRRQRYHRHQVPPIATNLIKITSGVYCHNFCRFSDVVETITSLAFGWTVATRNRALARAHDTITRPRGMGIYINNSPVETLAAGRTRQ